MLRVNVLRLAPKRIPVTRSEARRRASINRKPGKPKPWLGRRPEVTGTFLLNDNLPAASGLPEGEGVRGAASPPAAELAGLLPGSVPGQVGPAASAFGADQLVGYDTSRAGEDAAPLPAIGSVPLGREAALEIERASSHGGPTPLQVQPGARTRREIAESVVVPRHINSLFHKIMGWTRELGEKLDDSTGIVEPPADASPGELKQLERKMARKAFTTMKEKMEYGVLMNAVENDQFALEHKLQLAGEKFEKQFANWKGARLLDDPREEMQDVRERKTSLVMHNRNSFDIPRVNRDPCPGCGATLQNTDEESFGYVHSGEVEQYILNHQAKMRARCEYADRMAELQRHWEKNGRRVGEEWLDFMTQEEFDAIYRYIPKPFKCNRCHTLEAARGRFKDKAVMHAPDFTEQLRALREKKCLVVLVIDLSDFPGSMVHDLPGLISMNNPVLIVANKLDVIQSRRLDYNGDNVESLLRRLDHKYIDTWVREIARQFKLPDSQIKGVVPVSANKGWGIEQLIERIEELSNLTLTRPTKPLKTFFVGVCNVGKSSLINAIAKHLYVAQPPHPESKKIYHTSIDPKTGKERIKYRWYTPPNAHKSEMIVMPSRATNETCRLMTVSHLPGTTLAATAVRISLQGGRSADGDQGTYLFDTPGLFPRWYDSTILTKVQLARCLQVKYRNPRLYLIMPGHSLFIGGMAVIDVVKGSERGMLFAVYASIRVTTELSPTDKVEEFWASELGKKLYPPGSAEQVKDLRLTASKSYMFECFGKHKMKPKADVFFCGLGWVSFFTASSCDVVLRVRTLPGVIHGVRRPLRFKDLRPFKTWPRLPKRVTSLSPRPAVDKVIELTSEPFNPQDEPVKLVQKARHQAAQVGSDDAFELVKQTLSQQGKL